jgi:hypothetical protein
VDRGNINRPQSRIKTRIACAADQGVGHAAPVEFSLAQIEKTLPLFGAAVDTQAVVDKGQVDIEQQIQVRIAGKAVEPRVALPEHHLCPDGGDQGVGVEQHLSDVQLCRPCGSGAVHYILLLRDMDKLGHSDIGAMRLAIGAAIFGHDLAPQMCRQPRAKRGFACAFRTVKADARRRHPATSALRQATSPPMASTRNTP